jgi:hypothetical protein
MTMKHSKRSHQADSKSSGTRYSSDSLGDAQRSIAILRLLDFSTPSLLKASLQSCIPQLERAATAGFELELLQYAKNLAAGRMPANVPSCLQAAIVLSAVLTDRGIKFSPDMLLNHQLFLGNKTVGIMLVPHLDAMPFFEHRADFSTDLMVVACLHPTLEVDVLGLLSREDFLKNAVPCMLLRTPATDRQH